MDAAAGAAAIAGATADGPARRPGAPPAQALDHGTGHLPGAAVLRALTERQEPGYGRCVWLSPRPVRPGG
ncbi:hypothetical protein ACHBTE_29065 [Streptomyces sp. M41]|uniref:hypothetical protein n=1 Tax=Streptomyces sp. M41 TaxID=3059412 RepID=UPI00374CE236